MTNGIKDSGISSELLTIDKLNPECISKSDVVIFGGTFDPPHLGHISVVKRLATKFSRIIIAPTSQNPWKSELSTALEIRVEMLKAILKAESIPLGRTSDDVEIRVLEHGYIYSVDLVRMLRNELSDESSDGQVYWAVSEDLADGVKNWKNWDQLGAPTIVLPIILPGHATQIRQNPALAHPSLREIINREGLYRVKRQET